MAKRIIQLAALLILVHTPDLLASHAAEAAALTVSSRGDGICKVQKMPLGYVATGEFNSPECDSVNPFDLNAWAVEPIRQGILVCRLPDFEAGDANIMQYIPCGRKYSHTCAKQIDGGPNADVLSVPSRCRLGDIRYSCASDVFKSRALLYPPDFFPVARVRSAKCPPFPGHNFNQMIFRAIHMNETLPICARDYPPSTLKPGELGDFILPIRRFHSEQCPAVQGSALNALLLKRVYLFYSTHMLVCDKYNGYAQIHDDRCGTEPGINGSVVYVWPKHYKRRGR